MSTREEAFEEWWAEFLANNTETIAALELIKPFMKRAWDGAYMRAYSDGVLDAQHYDQVEIT